MILTELLDIVRFLFADTATSNPVYRESLLARPGNIIDGNNKLFFLLNRRISDVAEIYDDDGVTVAPTSYTIDTNTGKIIFNSPPTRPLYVDYHWLKLTDAEINSAVELARAKLPFDDTNIAASHVDALSHYIVSYCYTSAASRAAEYYTLSAAGKQVSKSELFNHYTAQAASFASSAEQFRKDIFTSRGNRDTPSGEDSHNDWATPYFPEDGGF